MVSKMTGCLVPALPIGGWYVAARMVASRSVAFESATQGRSNIGSDISHRLRTALCRHIVFYGACRARKPGGPDGETTSYCSMAVLPFGRMRCGWWLSSIVTAEAEEVGCLDVDDRATPTFRSARPRSALVQTIQGHPDLPPSARETEARNGNVTSDYLAS